MLKVKIVHNLWTHQPYPKIVIKSLSDNITTFGANPKVVFIYSDHA